MELEPDPEPSAKGYGWPNPVERLPAVPSYEPATGFDLAPVHHEPTEVVASWSLDGHEDDDRPGRIRLPRGWQSRNDKRRAGREEPPSRDWRSEEPPPRRRSRSTDSTELFTAVTDEAAPAGRRRRPRPRPRPEEPTGDRSTRYYVSPHAADPPR